MSGNKKINVLQFICPTGFYGAERWIIALAKHLPKDSIHCDLAVTLEDNSRDLELVKSYPYDCGDTFEIPMAHSFDIGVIKRIVNLIKERNIHILHTHGYKSDILGVIAAKMAGIKCVVTPHGFENTKDVKLRLYIWLGCKFMKYADAVSPLSPQLLSDTMQMGVGKTKIHYIQNGVDLSEVEAYHKERKIDSNSRCKTVGFIGQLISRKNVRDLLDTFNLLAEKRPDIKLVLVGDGDQRDDLQQYASTLTHAGKIEFSGFRTDRLKILQSFDIFVMTSTLEGIPRCLMEAFAMGVPVAAFDIPGIDQLITHEETGLMAKPGDVQTLCDHWDRILFDPVTAKKLSENARMYIYEHYSAQRMANEYLELFRKVLNLHA